jgi:AraC-like DNA-binding protein
MIRFGQYDRMVEFQKSPFTGNEVSLAKDPIRHWKNMVICSITLAARCAVSGGVDYETAMSMSDNCIQKVELATDKKSLDLIHKNMLKVYTKMVEDLKANHVNSMFVSRIRNYIEQNITEDIRVSDIADELNISRSYISIQFKKETGMNLNDFINRIKINTAEYLLTTTSQSTIDIASLLAFSSQSYFQTVFKRYTGMTPQEYRKHPFDNQKGY